MAEKTLDIEEILGEIQGIVLDVEEGQLSAKDGIKMIGALIDDYTEEEEGE